MQNLNELQIEELSEIELQNVDGGIVPLIGLYLAAFMVGYTIGKDIVQ